MEGKKDTKKEFERCIEKPQICNKELLILHTVLCIVLSTILNLLLIIVPNT